MPIPVDPTPRTRYQRRMTAARTDRERAVLEWDAFRADVADATNADQVWTELLRVLRTARTQLIPRRRTTR